MRHGHKGSASATTTTCLPLVFSGPLGLASVIPACYGTPSHITTYFLDPETSKNARSYQTAVPLAVASGVNIRIDRSSVVDSLQSGRSMLSNPTYSGGLLVVFWEHRHLPQLAAGLGWPEMPPIADNDFDLLYRLRYGRGETAPQVTRFSQSALLDGSQPCSQAPVPSPLLHQSDGLSLKLWRSPSWPLPRSLLGLINRPASDVSVGSCSLGRGGGHTARCQQCSSSPGSGDSALAAAGPYA